MGFFGKKRPASEYEKAQLASKLLEAEERYLDSLRREIANLIVAVDPDLMTRCYDNAWNFEREIADNVIRAEAEEAALVAKFPQFSDFDLRDTRHTITYDQLRNSASDDELGSVLI